MKKMLSLFLCVMTVFLIASCGINTPTKAPKVTVEIPDTLQVVSGLGEAWEYAEDSFETVIEVGYPYVNLYGDDADTYPRLTAVLEENYEKNRAEKLDFLDVTKMDIQQIYSQEPRAVFPHENVEKAYVRRADTKVLSILHDCYIYTGGMHGYASFAAENYDTATGKLLQLSDVVTDADALPQILWTQLELAYPDLPFWKEEVKMEELLADDRANWSLDYNGITFYFNPYDLAAYAYGRQQVTLSYVDFPDLVKQEYQAAPPSYGVELAEGCNFYHDVNSDGTADTICWGTYDDSAQQMTVTLNGKEYDFDHHSFDTKVTFLATRDGEYYLYAQTEVENDYHHTFVYRLGDKVEYVGEVFLGMRYYFHEMEDMYFTHEVLTNPDSFDMCTYTQMASTVNGYREYTVGKNGLPQSQEPFFSFEEETRFLFTALRDFSAEIYDEKTNTAKGTVNISAGETMRYYATDGEEYIYLLLEDGTLCRKKVRLVDHRLKIDGYPVEEMFDGLLYAG